MRMLIRAKDMKLKTHLTVAKSYIIQKRLPFKTLILTCCFISLLLLITK